MDIKHVLSSTIVGSSYRELDTGPAADNPPWSWVDFEGGVDRGRLGAIGDHAVERHITVGASTWLA